MFLGHQQFGVYFSIRCLTWIFLNIPIVEDDPEIILYIYNIMTGLEIITLMSD